MSRQGLGKSLMTLGPRKDIFPSLSEDHEKEKDVVSNEKFANLKDEETLGVRI